MLINQATMEQYAIENDIPIMQKDGMNFLIEYLQQHKINSVLEIGSAIGYSALMMASSVDNLQVETLERDPERYEQALQNIQASGLAQQVTIHLADALEFEPTKYYDLLFIDGAKAQYQKFYDRYKSFVDIVIVDNLDFHGMVDHVDDIKNRNTRNLVKKIILFRATLEQDPTITLTYHRRGDGILEIKFISKTEEV